MDPSSQLSTEALHTATLHIYIFKGDGPPSQSSTEALHTATLHIYIEGRWIPQSIEHRGLAYCYTTYLYI